MEMEAKAIIAKRASLDSTRTKYTEMLENDLDRDHRVLLRLIGMMKKMVTETPEPDSISNVVDSFKTTVSDHLELLQWAQKFDLADKGTGKKRRAKNGLTDSLLLTLLAETQCENGGLTDRVLAFALVNAFRTAGELTSVDDRISNCVKGFKSSLGQFVVSLQALFFCSRDLDRESDVPCVAKHTR